MEAQEEEAQRRRRRKREEEVACLEVWEPACLTIVMAVVPRKMVLRRALVEESLLQSGLLEALLANRVFEIGWKCLCRLCPPHLGE